MDERRTTSQATAFSLEPWLGNAKVVLLDGLDELSGSDETRNGLIQLLIQLLIQMSNWKHAKVCVSSGP